MILVTLPPASSLTASPSPRSPTSPHQAFSQSRFLCVGLTRPIVQHFSILRHFAFDKENGALQAGFVCLFS
jgi:hypothetical protein